MAHDHGQGIFTMEFIGSIAALKDVEAGRVLALEHIENSSATAQNKLKAVGMVHKSHTLKNLLLGMSNFSLSHQGLKAVRR